MIPICITLVPFGHRSPMFAAPHEKSSLVRAAALAVALVTSSATHAQPPPGATAPGAPLRVESMIQPDYPEELKDRAAPPTSCRATVTVDRHGLPQEVDVQGCPEAFRAQTRRAMFKSRWEPYSSEGPASFTMLFTFRTDDTSKRRRRQTRDPEAEARETVAAAEARLQSTKKDPKRAAALWVIGVERERLEEHHAAVEALEQRAQILERMRAGRPDDRELAETEIDNHFRLAGLHRDHLSIVDAVPHLERAFEIARSLHDRFPGEPEWSRSQAWALSQHAWIERATGLPHRAREHSRAELAIRTRILATGGATRADRLALSNAHWDLGGLASREGRFDDVVRHYDEGLAIQEAAWAENYDDDVGAWYVAVRRLARGRIDQTLGEPTAAYDRMSAGFTLARSFARANPDRHAWMWSLGRYARWLSEVEAEVGQSRAAADHRAMADAIAADQLAHERDRKVGPDAVDWGGMSVLVRRADALEAREQWEEALAARDAAEAIGERMLSIDPDNCDLVAELLVQRAAIADLHHRRGDGSRALEEAEEVRQGWATLVRGTPTYVDWREQLARAGMRVGELRTDLGDTESAEVAFRESVETWTELVELDGRVVAWKRSLADAQERAGSR